MKTALFILLVICSTAAFGQGYLPSSQFQPLSITDHPQHAANHALAAELNLRGDISPYTYARGERPLSDIAMNSTQISLGEIARQLRKEHAMDKKSRVVWENF